MAHLINLKLRREPTGTQLARARARYWREVKWRDLIQLSPYLEFLTGPPWPRRGLTFSPCLEISSKPL